MIEAKYPHKNKRGQIRTNILQYQAMARRKGEPEGIGEDEWVAICRKYANRCLCCKKRFPLHELTPDHIVPRSRGGRNTADNIQPMCCLCNVAKSSAIVDFREYSRLIPGAVVLGHKKSFGLKRPKPAPTDGYLTVEQACEILGVSRATLLRYVKDNRIAPRPKNPVLKRALRLEFRREDVERLAQG